MTSPEGVLEAIKRRWNQDGSALPSLVAGGLHHVRASETIEGGPVPFPYACLTISDGEPQYTSASVDTSGGDIILTFDLELKVYASSEKPNEDTKAIREQIDFWFNRDSADGIPIDPPARVMDLRVLAGPGLALSDTRNEGKDVAILTRRWEITVQGVT